MTTTLPMPLVAQRTPMTSDGKPSLNALYDCVAASLLACVMALKKIKELGGIYTPDNFKSQVYGDNYVGGTDAARYVGFLLTLGVKLFPVGGDAAQLVKLAHEHIDAGRPVVFTEVDPYVNTSLPEFKGWTHVCAWFETSSVGLTAMDPFPPTTINHSDALWTSIVAEGGAGQIWVAELVQNPLSQLIFSDDDLQVWGLIKSGIPTNTGIAAAWLRARWNHGWNFGPPLEEEHQITRKGIVYDEQQYTGARASHRKDSEEFIFYTPNGPIVVPNT